MHANFGVNRPAGCGRLAHLATLQLASVLSVAKTMPQDLWTFHDFASLPHGRFAIALDDSVPGRFTTWTIRHVYVSHFWTFQYQDVLLSPWTFFHLDISHL